MYKNRLQEIDDLKGKIDSFRPLRSEILRQIKDYYKIGLTYTSNALEGNTLDLAETKVVIEDGLTINGKPLKDHLETIGHAEAYNRLFELAKQNFIVEDDVKCLHKLFYSRINAENAGQYRKNPVIVTGAEVDFPLPSELPKKMQDFIAGLPAIRENSNSVEYAAMVHALFVNIHPFIDGNGRVARLLMNLALLQSGYNITVIPPVVRADYIRALQASNHKNFEPFINFISEMVYEAQKEYLRIIERLQ